VKILALTHRLPWPPNRGTTIRSYHILKYLASQHDVALLSFAESQGNLNEYRAQLLTFCKEVKVVPLNYTLAKLKAARALLNGMPLSVKAFQSKMFQAYFNEMIRSFKPDLVFTDSSALAFYPLKAKIPFIADFMDVDSEKWHQYAKFSKWPLNWIYKMESKRLSQFEKEVAEQSKRILVVSDEEESRLKVIAPQAKVSVIPNGVDAEYFKPLDRAIIPGRIVFTGVMNYFPNVDGICWFCREIWPKIKQQVPHASFYIVGINPTHNIRALSRLPGIVVTGQVADVRPYVAEAQVVVAPLRFSLGLQNKVLEAFAMGKVMVTTSGAVKGVVTKYESMIKVANTANKFAEYVTELLINRKQAKGYQEAGRSFIKKYYNWDKNLRFLSREFFGNF